MIQKTMPLFLEKRLKNFTIQCLSIFLLVNPIFADRFLAFAQPDPSAISTTPPTESVQVSTRLDEDSETLVAEVDTPRQGVVETQTRLRMGVRIDQNPSVRELTRWARTQAGKVAGSTVQKLIRYFVNEKVYRINLAITATLIAGAAYSISFLAMPSDFKLQSHWPVIVVSSLASGALRYHYKAVGDFVENGKTFLREHIRWIGVEIGYFIVSTASALAVGLKTMDAEAISSSIFYGAMGGLWAQGAFDAGIARIATRERRLAETANQLYRAELGRHLKGMIVSAAATGLNLALTLTGENSQAFYERPVFYLVVAMGAAGNWYYWRRARGKSPLLHSSPCVSTLAETPP